MEHIDQNEPYPVALTVAGSDSGGGAGIQADLRTFNAFGVFGCSAVTAVTAQNPRKVAAIAAIPAEVVGAQIATVLEAIHVGAVKTGMLFNAEIIEAVADAFQKTKLPLIVDPVMVSTSGARLLEKDAVEILKQRLLPLASWITPNLPEAELLLGKKLHSESDFADAARACSDRWGCSVLLKTGHAENLDAATDFLAAPNGLFRLESPRLDGVSQASHGTGCTLSAAMAAGFALHLDWKQVLCQAKEFVLGSLEENVLIGKKLHAMYPPVEERSDLIRLEKIK